LHLNAGIVSRGDLVPQFLLEIDDAVFFLTRAGSQLVSQFGGRLCRLGLEIPECLAQFANVLGCRFAGRRMLRGDDYVETTQRSPHRAHPAGLIGRLLGRDNRVFRGRRLVIRGGYCRGGSIDGLEERLEFGEILR
jgi:hypothetical protein